MRLFDTDTLTHLHKGNINVIRRIQRLTYFEHCYNTNRVEKILSDVPYLDIAFAQF